MHGGELGPLLHLHGSTIDELISRGGPMYGGNTAAGLDNFVSALPGAYAEAAVDKRIQSVSEKMVRADAQTYPELKVKASESRHLLKPMLVILQRPAVYTGTEHDDHRIECYKLLDALYNIIVAGDIILQDLEAVASLEHCDLFLVHYNWLAAEAMNLGIIRWNMTTKFHFLWHICYFACDQNPRASWCFSFEDFIGTIQASAMACTVGTPMHAIPGRLWTTTCGRCRYL